MDRHQPAKVRRRVVAKVGSPRKYKASAEIRNRDAEAIALSRCTTPEALAVLRNYFQRRREIDFNAMLRAMRARGIKWQPGTHGKPSSL